MGATKTIQFLFFYTIIQICKWLLCGVLNFTTSQTIFFIFQCWWRLHCDNHDQSYSASWWKSGLEPSSNIQIFMWNWCRVLSFWSTNLLSKIWKLDLWWISGTAPIYATLILIGFIYLWGLFCVNWFCDSYLHAQNGRLCALHSSRAFTFKDDCIVIW